MLLKIVFPWEYKSPGLSLTAENTHGVSEGCSCTRIPTTVFSLCPVEIQEFLNFSLSFIG